MLSEKSVDDIIVEVASMAREDLIAMISNMECSFQLDFTPKYLSSVSVERLRHIALAAFVHKVKG